MLWLALAIMTGLAVLIALWPLAFRRGPAADSAREAEFYRAQLSEIGRDVDRGLLLESEAAAARAEAGRRLIAAGDEVSAVAPRSNLFRRRFAALAIVVVTPLIALGIYGLVGQPQLPDEPLAARRADVNSPVALQAAIAKIEAHLIASPNDKRAWEVLAPVYMRLGRFADAGGAYRRLLALDGDKPATHANLGEALVAMSDGVVTADAREQFDQALKEAPGMPMARFYLALAAEQDGKRDEAKALYKELEPAANGRAAWMIGLRSRLAALEGTPPAEQAAAAEAPSGNAEASAGGAKSPSFTPEQRQMIQGMVQGLASRLAQKGGSVEEWARLIRAYSVLQETDKAKDALASARKALGSNADIDALAHELGI